MRLTRLRQQQLSQANSAFILFSDINISYISGFTGHAATVLLTPKANYLLTDYRYFEQAKAQVPTQVTAQVLSQEQATNSSFTVICRDRANQSLAALLEQLLQQDNCQQLAFEADHISVGQWQQIASLLSIKKPHAISRAVENLRYIKDSEEIAAIQHAANIADTALANIIGLAKTGITERELSNELEYQMAKLGSQALSFPTILLFGERSALPHGIPGDRQLKKGDFILIDFGAVVDGYRSDMTRTFVFGQASAQQKQVYDIVATAQQAAIDALVNKDEAATITGDYLYQQSANILLNSEYKAFAGEGLGHGVGLVLHEFPFIGPDCQLTIEKGCVITIEPGIYIPNWGGVRIEDDVVLTDNGLHILTQAPRSLIEL